MATVGTSATPVPDLLERARALVPAVRAAGDQIERDRQLPTDLVEQLRGAGMFHLSVPASYGGVEADPITASRIV